MKELPQEFWARVGAAKRYLLMLDYDGTLVPFSDRPDDALLPDRTRALLHDIATSRATRLVIFSGRRIAELEALVAPLRTHLIGEHGWDELTIEGHLLLHTLPGDAAMSLGRAVRAARRWGLGDHVERKRCSLTLHTRSLGHEETDRLEAACRLLWGDEFRRHGLRLTRIDGGIELRALARHEGTAVARLVRESAPGSLPIYLGDDIPDEGAFFELLGAGMAVRVGGAERDSLADYGLSGPEDVVAFLESWNERMRAAA